MIGENSSSMGYYLLEEGQLREGINKCIDKARRLLNDALLLIKDERKLAHAIGLYTFAMEEYGKALLLNECLRGAKVKGKYRVPIKIFRGKIAHELKLDKAGEHLPNNCRNLWIGVLVEYPLNSNDEIYVTRTSDPMIVEPDTTGLYSIITTVDWDVRESCFYVDWDDKNKCWKYELSAKKNELVKAISRFKRHLQTFKHV